VKHNDEEPDIAKAKGLVVFLDAVLCAPDQQAQRSIVDELAEDLRTIFSALLRWIRICDMKVSSGSVDDTAFLADVQSKLLTVAEVLSTTKGTKTSLKEEIAGENTCIE
jgi:hypothetical protein